MEYIFGRRRLVVKSGTNDSFELLFLIWKIIGVEHSRSYGFFQLFHVFCCWALLLYSPAAYNMGFLRALKTLPMASALNILQTDINVSILLFKVVIIKFHLKRLRSLRDIFKRLDERYHNPEERAQIDESVAICRRIIYIYIFVYFTFAFLSWITAIMAGELIYSLWLPFVELIPHQGWQYWARFSVEAFYLYFLILVCLICDVYPAVYIRAIRTHVHLLAGRISRLGSNPDLSAEENHQELVDCILSHQELMRVVEVVSAVTSLTLFLQFTVAAMILCVCMLNALIFADRAGQIMTVGYYMGVLLQTGGACFQASMLEAECVKLPLAIFHCQWLNLDRHSRSLLTFFMQRAQSKGNPLKFTPDVLALSTNNE
ncbi:unnamed protein product [Ceratitis capitata]|uniref:Odorant receptor n=1 Tax=Ceratitis capitata TaxID=7213 RepID=A0A811U0E8_CERCA|nr:unnamed protein product [Ceratitis capitata]